MMRAPSMKKPEARNTVGIIGFGQMGRFMAKVLSPAVDVRAFDPRSVVGTDAGDAVQIVSIDQAGRCDIVFLFPPIDRMRDCCLALRRYVAPGAIIVEGCSVERSRSAAAALLRMGVVIL
jgi:prephenate dehydrogenase